MGKPRLKGTQEAGRGLQRGTLMMRSLGRRVRSSPGARGSVREMGRLLRDPPPSPTRWIHPLWSSPWERGSQIHIPDLQVPHHVPDHYDALRPPPL